MKTDRSHRLVRYLIFTGMAVCFSAGMLGAQDWLVTFSLPAETHWAGAVLPAGSYTLKLNPYNNREPIQLKQGTRHVAMLMAQSEATPRTPAKSQLLLVREGNKATVHILYIAELGTAYHFNVPERYEVHTRLIARASEPAVIQRIPVIVSGK